MKMSELEGQIWIDGSFCDWKEAKIHILTHTLHYGTGVFEGVRAYETNHGPAIFRNFPYFDNRDNWHFERKMEVGIRNSIHKKKTNITQTQLHNATYC